MNNDEGLREVLIKIIKKYESTDDFNISRAYGDGGAVNPFPRLHRAVMNQMEDGDATSSRYAIWANTVRDNVVEATKLIKENPEKAIEHLKTAVNSLSCYSDIQAHFDPFEMVENNKEPRKVNIQP